jgi:hypothetical protein
MDVRRSGYGEHFVDRRFNHFPGVGASGNVPVLGPAKRRDGIQGAIPHQLGPQLAFDVFRDAAGNLGARKEPGNALGF